MSETCSRVRRLREGMEVGSVSGEEDKTWSGDEGVLFISPESEFFTLVGH